MKAKILNAYRYRRYTTNYSCNPHASQDRFVDIAVFTYFKASIQLQRSHKTGYKKDEKAQSKKLNKFIRVIHEIFKSTLSKYKCTLR